METNSALFESLKSGGRFLEAATGSDPVHYGIRDCYWAGHTGKCEAVLAKSELHGDVLFLDKEIQSASADEALYHEHLVHPLLNALAHKGAKRVLIVGGAEGATAREVLKWSADQVSHVDWVDIDGGLVGLCRRYLCWANDSVYNDPRLHFHACDIRLFWASNTFLYDAIILDLPDPDVVTAAETGVDEYPLYGPRFWEVVASRLLAGGGVSTHCGAVAPGAEGEKRRPGLTWNIRCAERVGLAAGEAYHTFIPSFHSEWGFWMSVPAVPAFHPSFPLAKCVVLTSADAQGAAFYWAPYWTSPFLGL